MRKIKEIIENTIVIDKSKFITTIYPVDNLDEINNLLSSTRKKYYG
jgi:putative IMPACT (imprinted ancient) family translation regulator